MTQYQPVDERVKGRSICMLERDTVDMVLASVVLFTPYGIRYSWKGGSRISQSQVYVLLTPFPAAKKYIINSSYVTKLVHGGDLNFKLVLLALERQCGMDLTNFD